MGHAEWQACLAKSNLLTNAQKCERPWRARPPAAGAYDTSLLINCYRERAPSQPHCCGWCSVLDNEVLGHIFLGRALSLRKSDDTAGDTLAHTLAVAALAALDFTVLGDVVVVGSFIHDNGATDNRLGATQVSHTVSAIVLSLEVKSALELLDVSDAAIINVLVRLALRSVVGVENVTNGLTAVGEVAVLVNFHGVQARADSLEQSKVSKMVINILGEVDSAVGLGVAKEVELACGNNLLVWLLPRLPVVVHWSVRLDRNFAGSYVRATGPGEPIGLALLVAVASLSVVGRLRVTTVFRLIASVGWPLAVAVALAWVRFNLGGGGNSNDRSSNCGSLGEHK